MMTGRFLGALALAVMPPTSGAVAETATQKSLAGKCVANTQETIGACFQAGVEFARLYLASGGHAATR